MNSTDLSVYVIEDGLVLAAGGNTLGSYTPDITYQRDGGRNSDSRKITVTFSAPRAIIICRETLLTIAKDSSKK